MDFVTVGVKVPSDSVPDSVAESDAEIGRVADSVATGVRELVFVKVVEPDVLIVTVDDPTVLVNEVVEESVAAVRLSLKVAVQVLLMV